MALSDVLAEALPHLDELSEALRRYATHPHYAEIRDAIEQTLSDAEALSLSCRAMLAGLGRPPDRH
jgi:hypothetical protein